MKRLISITYCLFFVTSLYAGTLPETLKQYAAGKGCIEIEDFFDDRPGEINPPFAFGYLPTEEGASAVFWCKNKSSARTYELMIWLHRISDFKCPTEISWINYPGGLSIINRRKHPQNDFRYLSNPAKTYPFKEVKGPIILSRYDGVGVEFYCHQGDWLYRQFH